MVPFASYGRLLFSRAGSMSKTIRIRKGLDIPLLGAPEQGIGPGNSVEKVALLGEDYPGLRPTMAVQVGDRVELGQTLFVDKRDPEVPYTAPGAGTVAAINRGDRRALLSVVIDLDADAPAEQAYSGPSDFDAASKDTEAIRVALIQSGLWTAFRTRPFSRVPMSSTTPRSIFVTAIDTRPLAADPATVISVDRAAFAAGLAVISRLPENDVYLCTGPTWKDTDDFGERVQHVVFDGPHPAGLVGTHIHHLDPVGANRSVWHIGYQDVIAVGRLFAHRRVSTERTVALGGPGFARPRLIKTRLGADVQQLVAGELAHDDTAPGRPRVISGSVLSGRAATGAVGFLGRYHDQITALPEGGERRLFGWLDLISGAPTFAGIFRRRRTQRRAVGWTTAANGRHTAAVPVEAFEHIIPLDLLPVPLLRALLVKDTDQAQALGCLELDPEDLSLCSFVCPAKSDYGAILRVNLDQIERDG